MNKYSSSLTDVLSFKPHLYRIMQVLKVPVNNAMDYNYMFSRNRNTVEYMGDFPEGHSAESISSMVVCLFSDFFLFFKINTMYVSIFFK